MVMDMMMLLSVHIKVIVAATMPEKLMSTLALRLVLARLPHGLQLVRWRIITLVLP